MKRKGERRERRRRMQRGKKGRNKNEKLRGTREKGDGEMEGR